MDSFFLAIPELTELKLNTEGDVFVGILIGHLSFLVLSGGILDTYMQKVTHQLQESTR